VRQEDKEIDGPDLEHAEERKRENELVEEKEDELHDLDGLPETTLDPARSGTVLAAMKKVLAGDLIVLNDLPLDRRHLTALEALKTSVEGKDQELSRFVYAEDRRTLLEQALAVLQPEIASIALLGEPFEQLVKDVGELREQLNELEDAEGELIDGLFARQKGKPPSSNDKNDDDDDGDGDDGDGDGNDGDDDDRSLTGPPREIAKPPSSLTGPPREPPAKKTTTLGDPKELAAAAKAAPRGSRG
jgi:hypothetical protein